MTTKKAAKKKKSTASEAVPRTEPKFPYTTQPSSLRKLLKAIPGKPKPDKIDKALLASWGFRNGNDYSMVRVLKAVNLLDDNNKPTERWAQFMHTDDAGKALGSEVRRVYAPLFQASHTPHTESAEKLKSLFNIHSGGSATTMEQQIATFKALAENADVSATAIGTNPAHNTLRGQTNERGGGRLLEHEAQRASININLHIHLPENKSRRDYEDMIEDIGRYIFGHTEKEARE